MTPRDPAFWRELMNSTGERKDELLQQLRDDIRRSNPYRYVGRAYDPHRPKDRRPYDGTILR